jgi:ribosome-associated heat shock protein Hsp15
VAGPSARVEGDATPKLRLDKWLFQARFFRSRVVAADVVAEGHLRLNGHHCLKPGHGVGPGDVLTFIQGNRVRVVRILALAERRGPAEVARGLYLDLDAANSCPEGGSALE